MGRRKPGLDVRSRAGSAWGGERQAQVMSLKPSVFVTPSLAGSTVRCSRVHAVLSISGSELHRPEGF